MDWCQTNGSTILYYFFFVVLYARTKTISSKIVLIELLPQVILEKKINRVCFQIGLHILG